jgi:hypothetical protein
MKKIKLKNVYECPNCLRKFYGYVDRCPICKKKVTKWEEENTFINIVKKAK